MKKHILLLFILSRWLCPLFALELPLQGCIERALKENPQMKIAEQRIIAARAREREAFGGYLPTVDANFTYIKRNEVAGAAALGGLPDTFKYFVADVIYDSKLSVSQPVFMWGKIYQAHRAASFQYKMAQEEYKKIKSGVIFEVKKAFYGFLLAKQILLIAQEAYGVSQEHLDMVRALYKEGKASSYDVSRAKVSLANVKTNLIKAENTLELAKQALINSIGGDKKDIEFTGEIEYKENEYLVDDLLSAALQNRPEIAIAEYQEKMALAHVKITAADNKPSVFLTGYKEWQNVDFTYADSYETWAIMGVVNLPIFNGFTQHQRKKQAVSVVLQSRESAKALKEAVELEVKAAYLNYKQAKDSIEANKENVALATDNLEIAQTRFRIGLMPDIEVRDAQLALTQAETNYIQALYDYATAIAAIEKSTGKE